MIERAHFPEDKEDIIRLWSVCFGDTGHYIEFFLDNLPPENVLFVYKYEGNIIGMFIIMPARIIYTINGNKKRGLIYYVYAVGVDPGQRGRGIAGKMLEFAREYAALRGAELCLVPATEKLGKYYAERGFNKFIWHFTKPALTEADIMDKVSGMIEINGIKDAPLLDGYIDELYFKRLEALDDKTAIFWDVNNFKFALIEHLYVGGRIYIKADDSAADGFWYIVLRKGENGFFVREAMDVSGELMGTFGLCMMITDNISYGKELINADNDKYVNFCFD